VQMMIWHFRINNAAAQSGDHCTSLHNPQRRITDCRTRSKIPAVCRILSHAASILRRKIVSLYWSLVDETFEMSQRRKSQGDLGRLSKQARKTDQRAASTYPRAKTVKSAGTPSRMNHIRRRTCSDTSPSQFGSHCSKKSLQTGPVKHVGT
jgi:hypothetical protein